MKHMTMAEYKSQNCRSSERRKTGGTEVSLNWSNLTY